MFEYNIKQQIKINFEGFYNYINDFINQDKEKWKIWKNYKFRYYGKYFRKQKEVINYLEKDLMFLFEHYNKYKN